MKRLSLASVFILVFSTVFSSNSFAESKQTAISIPIPTEQSLKNTKNFLKVISPYVLALSYFSYVEPQVKAQLAEEGVQNGVKKLLECFVGIWFLDKVKNHAKFIDALMGNPFDLNEDIAKTIV